MKRIKAVNGYTIYEATANDEKKYNVEAGYFYLYFSSDIRDYGISCCDPDHEAGSLEEAISFATGTNYAAAKEIVEETTTAATFEEIAEIEKLLDAGAAREDIEETESSACAIGFIQAQKDPGSGYYVAEYRHNIGWTTYGHYSTMAAADAAARDRVKNAGGLFNYLAPADQ